MESESNAPLVDPFTVGSAFVLEYYNHLYKSPSDAHKFYLEESLLGRPGLDGEMVHVSTLKGISDQLMSCDYENSRIDILAADSQASLKSGVATLVTGVVIGKDGERKKFSQSFFLVARNGSYFVLNDILRYTDVSVEPEVVTKEVEESPLVTESTEVVETVVIPTQAKAETTVTKPVSAVSNGHAKVPKEKVVNGNSNVPKAQEDAPKRSFAAIVGVQSPAQEVNVKALTTTAKPKPVEKPIVAPAPKAPAPVPERPSAETVEKPVQALSQAGTIFVGNLPMDATPDQLSETFKGFGAIRRGGIQVRSKPEKRDCYGFVTFENSEVIKDVFKAHKESAIYIGNRRASIEIKQGKDNENGSRPAVRNNGHYRNENGNGSRPRSNGSNGGQGGYGKQKNSAAGGDGKAKAPQKNGNGNAQTKK